MIQIGEASTGAPSSSRGGRRWRAVDVFVGGVDQARREREAVGAVDEPSGSTGGGVGTAHHAVRRGRRAGQPGSRRRFQRPTLALAGRIDEDRIGAVR
jgi:hypothetical protein